MIEEEDTQQPLTDEQITARLKSEGIDVTRRTVAKYQGGHENSIHASAPGTELNPLYAEVNLMKINYTGKTKPCLRNSAPSWKTS